MENSLEACARIGSGERFIRSAISRMGNVLSIRVDNSALTGLTASGGRFASSKAAGRMGYGLYSIGIIAKKYSGQDETAWDEPSGVFSHMVTLFLA